MLEKERIFLFWETVEKFSFGKLDVSGSRNLEIWKTSGDSGSRK
jgi:hypothetical protein